MKRARTTQGFTLIEVLVAVAVSVILLSILAFVVRLSTAATRDANNRVAITERLRSLNIRLRQEFGAMLPQPRVDGAAKPFADRHTFAVDPVGRWITFSSATVENGRAVNTDVKYEYLEDPGGDETKNVLIRWRDKTGPFLQDQLTRELKPNPKYLLGDDDADNSWIKPSGEPFFKADVMVTNVREVKFEAIDVPAGMPGSKRKENPNELNPRELPAAIRLSIIFGPEGVEDVTEKFILEFPIYRGL